MVCLAPCCS